MRCAQVLRTFIANIWAVQGQRLLVSFCNFGHFCVLCPLVALLSMIGSAVPWHPPPTSLKQQAARSAWVHFGREIWPNNSKVQPYVASKVIIVGSQIVLFNLSLGRDLAETRRVRGSPILGELTRWRGRHSASEGVHFLSGFLNGIPTQRLDILAGWVSSFCKILFKNLQKLAAITFVAIKIKDDMFSQAHKAEWPGHQNSTKEIVVISSN